MGVLASTNSTLSSILGAISTAADTAAASITTASNGLEMANAYVRKARTEQAIDYAIELENYEVNAVMLASQSQTILEERVMSEVSVTPERRAHYDRVHARISAALAAKRS